MRVKIKKTDSLVPLHEVPDGHLFFHGDTLCVKTEYGGNDGQIDAYIIGSGEYFWGGTNSPKDQRKVIVNLATWKTKK